MNPRIGYRVQGIGNGAKAFTRRSEEYTGPPMSDIRVLARDEFPQLLNEIPDPPVSLYCIGQMPRDRHLLTVVGSRKASNYGVDACTYLIKGLSGYPVTIVSGLALGIDGVAHRAALEAGLTTIAVPGSGLSDEVLYPRAHLGLAREIVARGGALLSEMEPHEPATPYSFPRRNRLMAGMSHATLIIEAGEKSGTLITAKLTVEYNRELLLVPHSIFSDGGAGGHIFMKLGAKPVRNAHDILESFGIEATSETRTFELSSDEQAVVELLSHPRPRDEILRELSMPIGDANVLLSSMELRGIITESLGEIRKTI